MKTKINAFALAMLLFIGLPLASSTAFVAVSVGIAPPAIPVYEQPPCPVEGYIWTPGYWAWGSGDYYWVPGVWVAPPRVGFYWTPGYWGYRGGQYVFINGYWGPTIGFYGGVNYGFGYFGTGYVGARWVGGAVQYNTAVTRVNTTIIHNTYVNKQVVKNNGSRASFNGPGGTTAKPTAQEQAAAKAPHLAATSAQTSLRQAAQKDPALQAKNNKGQPKQAALATANEKLNATANTGKGAKANSRQGANAGAEKAPTKTGAGNATAANTNKARSANRTSREARSANTASRAETRTNHPIHGNSERVNKAHAQEQTHLTRARQVAPAKREPARGARPQPKGKKEKEKDKPHG